MHYDLEWSRNFGMDILALGACLMFPRWVHKSILLVRLLTSPTSRRLAFVTLSNNLMILSLRSMFYEFTLLMLVAAFCFCGFLYALFTWVLDHLPLTTHLPCAYRLGKSSYVPSRTLGSRTCSDTHIESTHTRSLKLHGGCSIFTSASMRVGLTAPVGSSNLFTDSEPDSRSEDTFHPQFGPLLMVCGYIGFSLLYTERS